MKLSDKIKEYKKTNIYTRANQNLSSHKFEYPKYELSFVLDEILIDVEKLEDELFEANAILDNRDYAAQYIDGLEHDIEKMKCNEKKLQKENEELRDINNLLLKDCE